jgi:hypothetical protein
MNSWKIVCTYSEIIVSNRFPPGKLQQDCSAILYWQMGVLLENIKTDLKIVIKIKIWTTTGNKIEVQFKTNISNRKLFSFGVDFHVALWWT